MKNQYKPYIILFVFSAILLGCTSTTDKKEVDVQAMTPGEFWAVGTKSIPIWIFHRTPEEVLALRNANQAITDPAPFNNEFRSIRPDLFVVYGNCPGSTELLRHDLGKGFTCLSTGITYDLAGRPAGNNTSAALLLLPSYTLKNSHTLLVPNH